MVYKPTLKCPAPPVRKPPVPDGFPVPFFVPCALRPAPCALRLFFPAVNGVAYTLCGVNDPALKCGASRTA